MEGKKDNKLVLGIIIGLIIAAIVGLGTYIVMDKVVFNKNNDEEKNNKKETGLYKFADNYVLTQKDKEDIAKIITESGNIGNDKVDVNSIKISNIEKHDYVIIVEFTTQNNGSAYAWVYKVDGKINAEFAGTGWLSDANGTDVDKFENNLKTKYGITTSTPTPTATPVSTEKEVSIDDASVQQVANDFSIYGKKTEVRGLYTSEQMNNIIGCVDLSKATTTDNTMNIYVKMAFLHDVNSDPMANYDVANYYTDNTKSVLVESIQNVEFSKECDKVNFTNEKYPTYVYKFAKDSTGNYTYTSVEKVK